MYFTSHVKELQAALYMASIHIPGTILDLSTSDIDNGYLSMPAHTSGCQVFQNSTFAAFFCIMALTSAKSLSAFMGLQMLVVGQQTV